MGLRLMTSNLCSSSSLLLQSMDLSQSALQVSQPAANTGGMISSAAASVSSWLRTYTGQR